MWGRLIGSVAINSFGFSFPCRLKELKQANLSLLIWKRKLLFSHALRRSFKGSIYAQACLT